MNANGSNVRQLTHLKDHEAVEPAWSPDGSQIAFVSNRDYYDADTLRFRKDLYMINVEGSNLQRLTETGYAREPLWHPIGSTIIFRSTDSASGLYSLNMQSQNITQVKGDLSRRNHLHPNAWSTEGNQLLITARDLDQSQKTALYIYESNTDKLERIYTRGSIGNADWFLSDQN